MMPCSIPVQVTCLIIPNRNTTRQKILSPHCCHVPTRYFPKYCIKCCRKNLHRYNNYIGFYYVQIFILNTTIVLFYFISLHQALHVPTTTGHPQVLQIFVYNYQAVMFTFTFVYMWFLRDHTPDIGLLKSCVIYQ
jgi:hypothetical protein